MKLAVVGSRTGIQKDFVFKVLEFIKKIMDISSMISGGAKGAETYALEWATINNIEMELYSPRWKKHGNKAEAVRNQEIVSDCDQMLIFCNGHSKGTHVTLDIALKANKPIILCVLPSPSNKIP